MNSQQIKRKLYFSSLSLALLAGLCACSGSGGNDGFVDHDAIQAEYAASIKQLSWPPNYVPPAQMEGESREGLFQKGYGDSRASLYYECAWEREWLKTYANDKKRAGAALEALDKVPTMGYMKPPRADKSVLEFFNDYLQRAKLGDPSGFQENVKLNCPQ